MTKHAFMEKWFYDGFRDDLNSEKDHVTPEEFIADLDALLAAERERCATVCDDLRANRPMTERGLLIATECAVAIRERV